MMMTTATRPLNQPNKPTKKQIKKNPTNVTIYTARNSLASPAPTSSRSRSQSQSPGLKTRAFDIKSKKSKPASRTISPISSPLMTSSNIIYLSSSLEGDFFLIYNDSHLMGSYSDLSMAGDHRYLKNPLSQSSLSEITSLKRRIRKERMRRSRSQNTPRSPIVVMSPPMDTTRPWIYPLPSMPPGHVQAKKPILSSPLPSLMSNVRPVTTRVRRTRSNVGEY